MKVLNFKKEDKEIVESIKKLLEKEKIEGDLVILPDEELKGAIFAKVYANNVKNPEEAVNKTKKLSKEIERLFPNKYIVFSIHRAWIQFLIYSLIL